MDRKCVALVMAVLICSLGAVSGSMAEAEQSAYQLSEGDSAPFFAGYEPTQDTIVFDGKGDGYVLFCKRKFKITKDTVIEGEGGSKITLDALKIPCEAKVTYYRKPGKRNTYVALSIKVLGAPTPRPQ